MNRVRKAIVSDVDGNVVQLQFKPSLFKTAKEPVLVRVVVRYGAIPQLDLQYIYV
jgi:hypothetical protein